MKPDQFTEFRKDGWPLCPQCGENELYSRHLPTALEHEAAGGGAGLLGRYLDDGVRCCSCGWESAEWGDRR